MMGTAWSRANLTICRLIARYRVCSSGESRPNCSAPPGGFISEILSRSHCKTTDYLLQEQSAGLLAALLPSVLSRAFGDGL